VLVGVSQETRDKSQERRRSSLNHVTSRESRVQSPERPSINHKPSTINSLSTLNSPLSTHLTLLHCRGRLGGMTLILGIDDETGAVRVVSELAGAASAGGAARA
jgi:hypothetical protein